MSDNSDSAKSEKIHRLQRIPISAKVLLSYGEKMFLGFSKNLSEDGLFFQQRLLRRLAQWLIFQLKQEVQKVRFMQKELFDGTKLKKERLEAVVLSF